VVTLHLGPASIDLESGRLDGSADPLSERERAVLGLLVGAGGEPVSREVLGGGLGSRAADMAVSRLRRRLGAAAATIATVRGRGYRLDLGAAPCGGLDLGWARLRLDSLRVELPDRSVALTPSQAALLARLAEDAGHPVSRLEAARAVWGAEGTGAQLDLLVHRLRQRIEADPARPRFLVTVRGRGLVLLDARPAKPPGASLAAGAELVGRGEEVALARAALRSPARRAVLHGPPGVGKSALALRVLLLESPEGGWALVDLHGVDDPDEAELRLAAALRMDSARDDAVLARALAARGAFALVLDGALPGGWDARVDGWLAAAPRLCVLVAARAAPTHWPLVELRGLSDGDALSLLERSAGRPLGGAAERLVQRLDGNPLALELVGRTLERADPAELDRGLALPLTPLRHAWQAALDSLPEPARSAALALSLFRRPFDAADAAAAADLGADASAALDLLLARSVLQPHRLAHLALPHAARELLSTELRRSGALPAARRRVRARCLIVLERIAAAIPRAGGPALDELDLRWADLDPALPAGEDLEVGSARLLATLAREAGERLPRERREAWADDLSAAAERDELGFAARAACLHGVHALRWDRQSRGERSTLLRRALDLAARGGDAVLEGALAAELASVVAFSFGAAEARALLRQHPLPADAPADERVRRLRHAGRLAMFADQPREGLPRLAQALREAQEAGLPLLEARCRIALGQALSRSTRSQEAEHHLRRAIALSAEHGLPEQQVRASIRLSQHLLLLGLRAEAAALLAEAHNAAVRAGLVRLEEQCVSTLGFVLVGQGRPREAVAHLDRALELAEAQGARRAVYVALVNRGLARALAGDAAAGRGDLRRALDLSRNPGWFRVVGLAYQAVAELLDDAPDAAVASSVAALDLLPAQQNPDAAPLADALGALRRHAGGEASPADTRAWLAGWSGGVEVESVVQGLRAALGGIRAPDLPPP
jgi:DNA-binding response OmpR family regulator/tetratricopeptide (TPR) repeat protein